MIMKLKQIENFEIGDEVFCLLNEKCVKLTVVRSVIDCSSNGFSITYGLEGRCGGSRTALHNQVFKTKQDLLNSL